MSTFYSQIQKMKATENVKIGKDLDYYSIYHFTDEETRAR